jgi:hypothetical protein
MRWSPDRSLKQRLGRAAGLTALAAAVWTLTAATGGAPLAAKGVRLPFDYDEAGRIRAEFYAGEATLPDTAGDIHASDVRIVFSDAEGKPETTVSCGRSRFRLSDKVASSDEPVRIEKPGLLITGVGYRCNASEKVIAVRKDVRVVLDKSLMAQRSPMPGQGGGM